jgi:hypothetical protein
VLWLRAVWRGQRVALLRAPGGGALLARALQLLTAHLAESQASSARLDLSLTLVLALALALVLALALALALALVSALPLGFLSSLSPTPTLLPAAARGR